MTVGRCTKIGNNLQINRKTVVCNDTNHRYPVAVGRSHATISLLRYRFNKVFFLFLLLICTHFYPGSMGGWVGGWVNKKKKSENVWPRIVHRTAVRRRCCCPDSVDVVVHTRYVRVVRIRRAGKRTSLLPIPTRVIFIIIIIVYFFVLFK